MAQLENKGLKVSPQIFDPKLRNLRLTRAARNFDKYAFLHQLIIADLVTRLEVILRSFKQGLIYGPGGHFLPPALTPACGVDQLYIAHPTTQMAKPMPTIAPTKNSIFIGAHTQLPFADHSLDLVISIMSLHMENDVPRAMAEAHRVLKPDGLFLAALPGGNSLHELRTCLYQAETELTGGVSPRIIPFAKIKDLGGLLQNIGFSLPVADLINVPVTYRNPLTLLKDLQGMGETNVLTRRTNTPLRRDVLTRAMMLYQENFPHTAENNIEGVLASFEIIMLTGWAPHPNQQRPLARGSGKMSLAGAIEKFTDNQD